MSTRPHIAVALPWRAEMIGQAARQRYQEVLQRQQQLQQQQRARKAGSGRCQQIGALAYCED